MPASPLTHFNPQGQAQMVDVGEKAETCRFTRAPGAFRCRRNPGPDRCSGSASKGDVLGVARIAAIQAAKRTSELIPLCHPIALTKVSVDFEIDLEANAVHCLARAECFGRTGVEMEALCAASIGLLTIYDMCKAVDRGMRIEAIRLLEKAGGSRALDSHLKPADATDPDDRALRRLLLKAAAPAAAFLACCSLPEC
jgi:cyclic pyranopterin phosphate synthase